MSRKIIGVTVGTPISASKIEDELKPVKSVGGRYPDRNGNVDIDSAVEDILGQGAITLGIASDGLIYIFVNGTPVGAGIPQGQSGDVFGYVDENNTIVLNGNLADGTYSLKYEMENGNVVNIGNMVLDSNVYYSVTSTLTNCTINNSTKTVVEGGSYAATITAKDGYELKSVTVTMGGSPVSVSGGSISIANVTGDIVITAVAEEVQTSGYTNLADPTSIDWAEGYRLSISSGGTSALAGHTTTNFIPCKSGDMLRVKGLWMYDPTNNTKGDSGCCKVVIYNSSKSKITGLYGSMAVAANNTYGTKVSIDGDIQTYTILIDSEDGQLATSETAYLRIDGKPMDGYTANDVIITINEEIKD